MIEYKGEFYYPEFPDNFVSGIIIVDENRNIVLELFGSLNDHFSSSKFPGTTIYGNLFNGKKATLLSCSNKNFEIRFGVSQLELFKAQFLLIGTHIPFEEEPFFTEITVDIDHLAEWIGVTGASLTFQDGLKNLTFTYTQPENIEFPINDDLVGTFFFRRIFPIQAWDFKLEERTYFSISSKNVKSLASMISFIREFRKLLSFFIGTKTKINQLVLISPNETIKLINPTTNKIHFEEIHLFFNDQDDNINKSVIDDFPIKYANIVGVFPEILSNWYDRKQVDLVPIGNILLECLVNKSVFDDNHFLTAFQGVEAFHRRFIQNTAALKVIHKAYMKSILDFIDDPDLKAKLTAQLTFAYEMTAKQRFAEIIPKLILIMPNITEQQIEIWIKEMVNSRNYLTHLDPSGLKKKAGTGKLIHYTELLKATLSFLVMSRIGIPPEYLKGIGLKYRHSIEYLIKDTKIVSG